MERYILGVRDVVMVYNMQGQLIGVVPNNIFKHTIMVEVFEKEVRILMNNFIVAVYINAMFKIERNY